MTASGIVLPTVTWPLPRSRMAGRSPRASPTRCAEFLRRDQIGRGKNRHAAGEETAVIVHRLEPAVGDRKNIRHARVDAGYRIDPRLGFHDRRVQPGFKGRRMVAVDHFTVQVQGQQLLFTHHCQTDTRGDQEAVAVGNARADMAETFDQFQVRKNPAGADDVFSQLIDAST